MSSLTKMFIVLTLVFSLVMSVILVLGVSKMDNYKNAVDGANGRALAATAMLTAAQSARTSAEAQRDDAVKSQLAALASLQAANSNAIASAAKADSDLLAAKAELSRLTNQVTALTAANTTGTASIAAKDDELSKLRPQVADLITKNNEIYRAKNEADNQLRASEQAIRKLQEQISAATTTPGAGGGTSATAGGSDSQVTVLSNGATSGPVNAKVTKVGESAGRTLIELPLGTRDGIQVNTRLFIYRGNAYIADAVIQRTTPDQSVAAVLNPKTGTSVQEGDMVSTISK